MFRKYFTDEFGMSSMHVMKECMFPFSIAIGLQKDSPYNDRLFSSNILATGCPMFVAASANAS